LTEKDYEEELIKNVEEILAGLNHPVRWVIACALRDAKSPLSFIEIKKSLRSRYESNVVWLNLKYMKRKGVIKLARRRKEKKRGPGRPKTAFYELTDKGKMVLNYLDSLMKEWQKRFSG
jgi:predicted transcriptional regulator